MNTPISIIVSLICVVLGCFMTWCLQKMNLPRLLRKLADAVALREYASLNEEFWMTQILARKIKRDGYKPDLIIGVSPGGGMIAEWLGRRFLGTSQSPVPVTVLPIVTERRDAGIKSTKASVDEAKAPRLRGLAKDSKVLLVNDISRGGKTLEAAYDFLTSKKRLKDVRTATLLCSKECNVEPWYYAKKMAQGAARFDWKQI
ncbi:MAG: hypothetical protein JSU94_18885 [Phycisphaerales bacterium]|nr:MAG: hypothetical protein JSU94_18885 [Phycisphaerales bacterium]